MEKKYSVRYLFDIRKLYLFVKVHPLGAQLTMSHYRLLFPLNDDNEINYYINQIIKRNLSKRELEVIIKSNEYGRLPEYAKNKFTKKEKSSVVDFVKSPIQIKNNWNNENDNSNVIYFNYNNYKFLFVKDERIEKEKDILEKYNLKKINQDKTIGIIISKKENKYSHKIKCEHF